MVLVIGLTVMHLLDLKDGSDESLGNSSLHKSEGVVSFYSEVPVSIQLAMKQFIDKYPNWDQYRLVQAALAGFLMQNGVESRSIARLYVGNMFGLNSFVKK